MAEWPPRAGKKVPVFVSAEEKKYINTVFSMRANLALYCRAVFREYLRETAGTHTFGP